MAVESRALSESAFVDRVGRLTQSELTAFVAALWDSRGFSTQVDGDLVRASRDGRAVGLGVVSRRTRRPGVWRAIAGGSSGDDSDGTRRAGVDRLVLGEVTDPRAPDVIDARALYELVAYGVDRAAARRLVADHLGLPFDALPVDGGQADPATTNRRSILAACGTFLGFGVVIWFELTRDEHLPTVEERGLTGETAVRSTTDESTVAPTTAGVGEESLDSVLAPGITTAGLVDIYELARTHARLASETSYQWDISYRELVSGRTIVYGSEHVHFERPGVFSTRVEHGEGPLPRPSPINGRSTYADGETRYVRIDDGDDVRVHREDVRQDGDRMATRAKTYLDWYLYDYPSGYPTETDAEDAGTTRVGHHQYRVRVTVVTTETDPRQPFFDGYSVQALIDERGFVHSLRSRTQRGDRVILVEFTYTRIGATTVAAPGWLVDAAM